EDGIKNASIETVLSWDGGDPDSGDIVTYEIYFGESPDPPYYDTISKPATQIRITYSGLDLPLKEKTTYYWKIKAEDTQGHEVWGETWHFTTGEKKNVYIREIKSYYKGFFFQGIDLQNTYTAIISGNAEKVEFEMAGEKKIDTDGSDGWTATFNMGYVGSNPTLKVTAYGGGDSDTKTFKPTIVPYVGWLLTFIDYILDHGEYGEHYIHSKTDYEYDNIWELYAGIDFSTSTPESEEEPIVADVPGGVPKKLGEFSGGYGFSAGLVTGIIIDSDRNIRVSGYGGVEVEVKNKTGHIEATLCGILKIKDDYTGVLWKGMWLDIKGDVEIPIFWMPFNISGIGVETGIDIVPHVEVNFSFAPSGGSEQDIVKDLGIKINTVDGNVGLLVKAYLEICLFIGDFYVEAGGDATLYLKTPPDELGYFDNFALNCYVAGKLRIAFWTLEGKWSYEWRYRNGLLTLDGKKYDETGWIPIERDYKNDYNEFKWKNGKNSGIVIQNAFPYEKPSTAADPHSAGYSKIAIVWAHDNIDEEKVKGMELKYAVWDENGKTMTKPITIPGTNDNRLQMDPQIAYDKNGNLVCVFVQTDETVDADTDPQTAFSKMEIAYCIRERETGNWSKIKTITNNNRMDISPILAYDENNNLILVWTSDADKNHKTIRDRSIYAAFWNSESKNWSEPQAIANNVSIISVPSIAYNNGKEAICVFSVDKDDDAKTLNDQEICYTKYSSGKWGKIEKFTDDNEEDLSPSVVYASDGRAYITWVKKKPGEKKSILCYKSVGGRRTTIVTSGILSTPSAIRAKSTSLEKTFGNTKFVIGWQQGIHSEEAYYAKIKVDGIDIFPIYTSSSKISQLVWCSAPDAIAAVAVERGTVENGKNCNLIFSFSEGIDIYPPETTCQLDGNSKDGYNFESDVVVTLTASDLGGAGVAYTKYSLDGTPEKEYRGPFTVKDPGYHTILFYSADNAGNREYPPKSKDFRIKAEENKPPNKPTKPSGPTNGKAGTSYSYSTSTTDPDGDKVRYLFDWGDGKTTLTNYHNSGEKVSISHIYLQKGSYRIRVRAQDSHSKWSEWSDPLLVTMPISYVSKFSLTYLIKIACLKSWSKYFFITKNLENGKR
ncbi:MAG: PKD domain-containing protein, partial [Thermoplasmata archaeon]|nr:PKD domain-containing protein [Thermoplasmata archaeon]